MDEHANALTKLSVFVMAFVLVWAAAVVGLDAFQEATLPVGYGPGASGAPAVPDPVGPLPVVAKVEPPPSPPPAPDSHCLGGPPVPDVPRVKAVSQFDGGPMQGANCTLAAGAMLAHSAFGMETTGSELRTHQFDWKGGTSLVDMQTALFRGLGVTVHWARITPDQLRALLSVGAGVVIEGDYERIPVDWRLQRSLEGGHAIYVDAYYPGNACTPPAYYVIDPLGRGSYAGSWWHASVIDDFAAAVAGDGHVLAAWAPAQAKGGT